MARWDSLTTEGRLPSAPFLLRVDLVYKIGIIDLFRDSSAVERLPVKEDVAGSIPAPGAKEDNTNLFFEDPDRIKLEVVYIL